VRVDEVFASHLDWVREMLLDEMAVVEALCCASLVGGAPLFAFKVFNGVQVARLEKWLVRDIAKPFCCRRSFLADLGAFIERALNDYRS